MPHVEQLAVIIYKIDSDLFVAAGGMWGFLCHGMDKYAPIVAPAMALIIHRTARHTVKAVRARRIKAIASVAESEGVTA